MAPRSARPPKGWRTPYALPGDVASLLVTEEPCHNMGLHLDRLVRCEEERGAIKISRASLQERLPRFDREPLATLLREVQRRHEAMLQSVKAAPGGRCMRPFCNTTDWRMAVGLGADSVLETSLALHRLYGLPIIPGSALKGLTRSYVLLAAADAEFAGKSPEAREKTDLFCQAFGTIQGQGRLIFFDALPASTPVLELDVMTPHVGEYYRGRQPPADYLSPVPVTFLTVAPGCSFSFAVAATEDTLAARGEEWLKAALQTMGVGAKTTSGYGYFADEAPPRLPDPQGPMPYPKRVPGQPDVRRPISPRRDAPGGRLR